MTKITMPRAGQSMEEGTILRWLKNEGDPVKKGEILLEIETDKANVEVEATESGILRKILCPAGVTIPVLTPIAILADATEDISSQLAEAEAESSSLLGERPPSAAVGAVARPSLVKPSIPSQPAAVQAKAEPQDSISQEIKASPAARKSAQEHGVVLSTIWPGSGPGGRILSSDVARTTETIPAATQGEALRRPMSAMRRAIARNLIASKQNIPHFYMRMTIDAAPLYSFYRSEKAKYPCTLNDVLTLACARVVREFPAFRTRIENDELVEYPTSNIGMAVGMEDGLRVPVLMGADRMSLRQVADESRRIVEAAKQGKVEAMGQGVFTISNLGMYGVEEFAAIINPPEAALLAVGALRETVIVKDGAMRAARVMTMTLSADHRIIDGLMAARFLNRLRAELESPESLGER